MAMEVLCPGCHGRLLVETAGVVVACPHCGMHLQAPAAAAPPPSVPAPSPVPPSLFPAPPPMPPARESIAPDLTLCDLTLRIDQTPVRSAAPGTEDEMEFPWQPVADDEQAVTIAVTETNAWSSEPASPAWPADDGRTEPFPDFMLPADGSGADDEIPGGMTVQIFEQSAGPVVGADDATMMEFHETFPAPGEPPAQPDFGFLAETAPDAGAAPSPVAAGATVQLAPTESVERIAERLPEAIVPLRQPPEIAVAAPESPVVAAVECPAAGAEVGSSIPAAVVDQPASAEPVVPSPEVSPRPQPTAALLEAGAPGVSPLLFKVTLSYASAMTIACAYLIYQLLSVGTAASNNLESLPDKAPPRATKGKTTSLQFIPPEAPMPWGHTLALGESQRFGSLRLTPLRVTRGALEFVHYDENSKAKRDAAGPVLKLYLRMENVSDDQEFPPLDRDLVFGREADKKDFGLFLSNNWVCKVSEKKRAGQRLLVYDLPIGGAWNLKGQDLDRELKPGETMETYIPTAAEEIDTLTGQLVWRVHFRKGYNPQSLRGVTTVVEVVFDSDQIEIETAAPAAPEEKPAEGGKPPPAPAAKQNA